MFRFIFLSVLLLPFLSTMGQKAEVYDELKSAFAYGKEATEKAEEVLGFIRKAMMASSVEDMHHYARKAKYASEEGKSAADYAEDDASDAEDDAGSIDCSNAAREADDAEDEFSSAGDDFDETYTGLRRAENEEEKDDIAYELRRARTEIEEAMSNAEDGMEEINNAIDELNDCD